MTVGELLKEYRIKQNKNQKEFAAGIVSQSYYSKVEKNIHRITVDDLLLLLTHNAIPVKNFFEKLEIDPHQQQLNQVNALFEEVTRANYADNSLARFKKIKEKAINLDIEADMKKKMLLIIDGFLESEKDDPETFDFNLRNKIKEELFLMPEYDTYKLSVYANFVDLYDFDSNRQIIKQIVKALEKKKVERQDEILFAIILNVLKQGVEEKKDSELNELIKIGHQIFVIPEFFMYRETLTFYEELIAYRTDKKERHLKKCELILESFEWGGMSAFGKGMLEFLNRYKEK
ncbi:helix-turn-helix domain-containing protein [Lactobacillus hominis]|uniref:Transcriptional regulator, xre family n=1 Tax=Lactobacillus hominis DSM 23910 = CRBIP 24.179 TaxID=1423758 RepID=I7IW13_9LACO|nr:helix-turn-helix transcriptional regulator [Lactobacillus hominis]KRM84980.1 XRE family transcriptional regulator [Lactobacillus hominis DSM 23910 = CRBIP 24.179]MCT3348001.1 XRE family transcriptional regulator [Lactobacillus hominis]CCI82393.1 Transcriptional regulator, xre family [Lactobacillus hominis DSM 23910 = CRBIP 24.179]